MQYKEYRQEENKEGLFHEGVDFLIRNGNALCWQFT
jgi:hypothetical protein